MGWWCCAGKGGGIGIGGDDKCGDVGIGRADWS